MVGLLLVWLLLLLLLLLLFRRSLPNTVGVIRITVIEEDGPIWFHTIQRRITLWLNTIIPAILLSVW